VGPELPVVVQAQPVEVLVLVQPEVVQVVAQEVAPVRVVQEQAPAPELVQEPLQVGQALAQELEVQVQVPANKTNCSVIS
jgi:hypothetical protein